MKIIKYLIHLLKKIKPRYQLSLDSSFYSLTSKKITYRFKVFGEHTFAKFTFEDLENNKRILYDINPKDLIRITIDEYIHQQNKSMFKIVEILRGNKYKISNGISNETLTGDEICENVHLISKIKNIDLYKIAYQTGFTHGRQLAKEIHNQTTSTSSVKIVPLQIIKS